MKFWEYMIVEDIDDINYLDELGAKGWELVAVSNGGRKGWE